ncbi:type II toxin-antitoxin system prevent-host-death family antitoxin [bacterium]|nr:type II toxin-antitoxin system prevent-host-death family antitoxin [bacterium]
MAKQFSIYEAKAKLSELLRHVKANGTAIITERGLPIAEIVPYKAVQTLSGRYQQLTAQGYIVAARKGKFSSVVKKTGALDRFLKERE